MHQGSIFAKQGILYRKHSGRERAITATGNQFVLTLLLEKTVKGIILEEPRQAREALGGKHIVGDDDSIILRKIMLKSIGVKEHTQYKQGDRNGFATR